MRKWALFVSLVGLCASAAASFDLVLVLDRFNRAVHRYDGNTGTYLGKIDMPVNGTLRGMALDQANQRVFVSDSLGFHVYNYNTGAHLFSNVNSAFVTGMAWVGGSTGLVRGTVSGNGLFRMTSPTSSSSWAAFGVSLGLNAWLGVGVDSTGDPLAIGNDGTLTRNTEETRALGGGSYGQLTVRGTQFITTRANDSTIIVGNTQNLIGATVTQVPGMIALTAGAFGHENIQYYVGKNPVNTSQGMVYRVSTNTIGVPVSIGAQFGTSQLVDPAAVAVVLAPEPGTMIALGAGVLALLRRRVRR